MQTASLLPLFTPTASFITTCNPNSKASSFNTSAKVRKFYGNPPLLCRAGSSITDFDLYDLLGIDNTSNKEQIKLAYRALQKRCHPDIAGEAGHDMAIILNEAYALLSDPTMRLAYDKEQAKISELRGYTGKPIYSVWFGSESEERAVFVDELKCVGCLKCALFAEKTFAIESVYGRARVVAQWADPEHKIHEAIDACPVDCISITERSNLAALEFLMSKQPRGSVRIGAGNTVGTRVSNVFADVEKFQERYRETMDKASEKHSKESEYQREARNSAIQAIRSISNWLYWKTPIVGGGGAPSQIQHYLSPAVAQRTAGDPPNIKKIRDAAAARKQSRESIKPIHGVLSSSNKRNDGYWKPSTLVLPEPTENKTNYKAAAKPSPTSVMEESYNEEVEVQDESWDNPFSRGVPVVTAIVAAAFVRLQMGEKMGVGLEQHIGGSMALDVVNSTWLQAILAGTTWYLIGMAIVELVQIIQSKLRMY